MTTRKQLKLRVRARMAKTGERYTTALRHVAGDSAAPDTGAGIGSIDGGYDDGGWRLRGGVHPETSAIANVLANLGVTVEHTGEPLSEAMVLGAGGGLGAAYILWEFKHDDSRHLTLGYRNGWLYTLPWVGTTLERLGVPASTHTTGGAKGAATRLTDALAAGTPCIVWPDRYLLGYWQLPPVLEAHGGHLLVAYAESGGAVRVDDRNLAPLTVPRADLDAARARVVSYKNALVTLNPDGVTISTETVREAARAGLRECAENLSKPSDSFSLPAWRKWARLLTDTRNAKAWPKVFADRRGLTGALLSAWEGIEPVGMTGGHLRDLYAEFLGEAAELLDAPALRETAASFRAAARAWHDLAEIMLPASVPAFAHLRELTATVQQSVISGDDGRAEAAEAGRELWARRGEHADSPPLDEPEVTRLFADASACLTRIYETEVAAATHLREAVQTT